MSGVASDNSKFKIQNSKVRMSANSLISIVKELGFGDQTPTKIAVFVNIDGKIFFSKKESSAQKSDRFSV